MSIRERLELCPELRDTSKWPVPRREDIAPEHLDKFDLISQDITDYLRTGAVASKHLCKSELYRYLERALELQPNGEIYGFHAIVGRKRLGPTYKRQSEVSAEQLAARTGMAGAFQAFMDAHPDLQEFVDRNARRYHAQNPEAIEKGLRKSFRERVKKICSEKDYPRCTRDQGIRPLRKYIQRLLTEDALSLASTEIPAPRLVLPCTPTAALMLPPYAETEHDGHKGDFFFVLKLPSLQGNWLYTAPLRLWLLLLLDRGSRAILQYAYRFGSTNYPAKAVLETFHKAFTRWTPRVLTLPGLRYAPGAGFPNGVLSSCDSRMIDLTAFDNAKANIAQIVQQRLTRSVGTVVNCGRAGEPLARAFVERLNRTLETSGFRKLPTGFDPNSDDDGMKRAFEVAKKYAVTEDEVEQVLDTVLANYNAEHHSQIGMSPLQAIEATDAKNLLLRTVEDVERIRNDLGTFEVVRKVRGGGNGGHRPFVEYVGGIYSNPALKKVPNVVGRSLRLIVPFLGDARYARGILQMGASEVDLGILTTAPPYSRSPHTLEQRRLMQRYSEKNAFRVPLGGDMVEAFDYVKRREAKERAAAASELARAGMINPVKARPRAKIELCEKMAHRAWIKIT